MNRVADRDEMLRRFKEAKDPQTEERYRAGLTAFADEAMCLQLFDDCFEAGLRTQDAPIVIARLSGNRVGGAAVWERVTERWDEYWQSVPPLMQFALGFGIIALVPDVAFVERARRSAPRTHFLRPAAHGTSARAARILRAVRLARAPETRRDAPVGPTPAAAFLL